jgi:hypothetical protein
VEQFHRLIPAQLLAIPNGYLRWRVSPSDQITVKYFCAATGTIPFGAPAMTAGQAGFR